MAKVRGGDKAVAKLRQVSEAISNAKTVQVGFLEGATYPDGTPVAMVAAIQNYGAPSVGIPPRPFFSNMIAAKSSSWGPAVGDLLTENNGDAFVTLSQMGEGISAQLRDSIQQTNEPALAESTIRARGVKAGTKYDASDPSTFGAKPLVDTGHMLQSIDYNVKA